MHKKLLKLITITVLSFSMFTLSIPASAEEIKENTAEYTEKISQVENTNSSDEEVVDIPDKNLKRALNIQLGKSEDSDLTKGELKVITNLDISNSNITSLKGLEYCGNLVSLNISHNNVIDISPLENLSNIADLNLSYNRITDIKPLEGLKNLASIDTTSNAVGNLSILDGLFDLNVNADYDKTADITILEDLDSLLDIDVSKDSNVNLDFSSNLDEIIGENKGGSSSDNSSSNSSSTSNLGSGILNALGNIDITKLFGSFGSSGYSTGIVSLNSLGTGSSSLGSNSSLLSSSSFLTDSSNTKSASPIETGDSYGLSGIVTLSALGIASFVSLILNGKKHTSKN